jgi:hypothetical protein
LISYQSLHAYVDFGQPFDVSGASRTRHHDTQRIPVITWQWHAVHFVRQQYIAINVQSLLCETKEEPNERTKGEHAIVIKIIKKNKNKKVTKKKNKEKYQ